MASVLRPCDAAPHAGLALGSDALRLALAETAPWVARLVCRAFRDTCPPGEATQSSAVESVARLELAIELGLPTDHLCAAIAYHGHLEVLQWAASVGHSTEWLCDWAAQGGHLEVMRWARATGHQTTAVTAWFAGGHLEMLKWLRADGCPWDAHFLLSTAAANGRLATVQWAHALGDPIVDLCEPAAAGGALAVLRWLRQQGCPWKGTMREAVSGGHLEVVEWAASEGCPHDVDVSVVRGGLPMYEWLDGVGFEWARLDVSIAVYFDETATSTELEWLVARGARLHPGPVGWVGQVSLEALAWLVERGSTLTAETFAHAAADRRIDVVEWLHARGCPFDVDACIAAVLVADRASRQFSNGEHSVTRDQFRSCGRRREVLAWLEAHRPFEN
jgi:hypothetical protein